jgi:endonuclease/exonuclease/phosphatase (EEP) superfamily protein YafD
VVSRTALALSTQSPPRIGALVPWLLPSLSGLLCLAVLPVVLARLLGGGPPQPWPKLAVLAAPAVPVAALALALALAARPRGVVPTWWLPAAAVPAALLVLLVSWQLAPLLGSGRAGPAPAGAEVRVLTVNAWLGGADAGAVAELVRSRGVDVLTVQELTPELVDRLHDSGLDADLPHSLVRAKPSARGIGIWSRWPLDEAGEVAGTGSITPRALVRPPSGAPFTVLTVHPFAPMTTPAAEQWASDLRLIAGAARDAMADPRAPGRLVVAGDFNAGRDHAPFRDLLRGGLADAQDAAPGRPRLGYTYPNDRRYPPLLRLDHVLADPRGFAVRSATTLDVPGSDHRAVLAVLAPR